MTAAPRIDAMEVVRASSLLEVVRGYVEMKRVSNGRWRGLCPFHAEKTPSFTVREKEQRWYCFGCGEGGNVIDFVRRSERVGFREACRRLGAMDLQPAPFRLWEHLPTHVIPCEGKGCGAVLEVDLKDVPHVGREPCPSWRIRRDGDDIRGLCLKCVLRWRKAQPGYESGIARGARDRGCPNE